LNDLAVSETLAPELFARAASLGESQPLIITEQEALEVLLVGGGVFGYPAFMFRREAWQRKGGVDESLRTSSDYDLLVWLSTNGRIAAIPEFHYRRRLHTSNITRDLLPCYLEQAAVQARHLSGAARALAGENCAALVVDQMMTRAYWLREAHSYRAARQYVAFAALIAGWHLPIVSAMAKIWLHDVSTTLTGQLPRHTNWTRTLEPRTEQSNRVGRTA
jgi:hypothetical protein